MFCTRCLKHRFLGHSAFEANDPVGHTWSILKAVVVGVGCTVVNDVESTYNEHRSIICVRLHLQPTMKKDQEHDVTQI